MRTCAYVLFIGTMPLSSQTSLHNMPMASTLLALASKVPGGFSFPKAESCEEVSKDMRPAERRRHAKPALRTRPTPCPPLPPGLAQDRPRPRCVSAPRARRLTAADGPSAAPRASRPPAAGKPGPPPFPQRRAPDCWGLGGGTRPWPSSPVWMLGEGPRQRRGITQVNG